MPTLAADAAPPLRQDAAVIGLVGLAHGVSHFSQLLLAFRQGSDVTNALQTPKLPDWALIDLTVPPSAQWPGKVTDAGFFDEGWGVR